MNARAESIARRLSADLFDLRELARDDEETAHAIRIAVIAELEAALIEACDAFTSVDGRPELRADGMTEQDHRGRARLRQSVAALREKAGKR